LLAEDGNEDFAGAVNGQNIEDGSSIDTGEVVMGERITTINVIDGAII